MEITAVKMKTQLSSSCLHKTKTATRGERRLVNNLLLYMSKKQGKKNRENSWQISEKNVTACLLHIAV